MSTTTADNEVCYICGRPFSKLDPAYEVAADRWYPGTVGNDRYLSHGGCKE